MKFFDKIKANAARVFGWDKEETAGLTEAEFDAKLESQESIADLNKLNDKVADLEQQIEDATKDEQSKIEAAEQAENEANEANENRFAAIEANVKALQEKNKSLVKGYDAQIEKLETANTKLAEELNKAKAGLSVGDVDPNDDAGISNEKKPESKNGDTTTTLTAEEAKKMW